MAPTSATLPRHRRPSGNKAWQNPATPGLMTGGGIARACSGITAVTPFPWPFPGSQHPQLCHCLQALLPRHDARCPLGRGQQVRNSPPPLLLHDGYYGVVTCTHAARAPQKVRPPPRAPLRRCRPTSAHFLPLQRWPMRVIAKHGWEPEDDQAAGRLLRRGRGQWTSRGPEKVGAA